MEIIEKIIELLTKYPDGLKASKMASLIGTTRHEINSCLYSHTGEFEIDGSYVWTMKTLEVTPTPARKPIEKPTLVTPVISAVSLSANPGKRYAYYNTLDSFLSSNEAQWIEEMREGFNVAFSLPLGATQIGVWRDCYRVLKRELIQFNEQHDN